MKKKILLFQTLIFLLFSNLAFAQDESSNVESVVDPNLRQPQTVIAQPDSQKEDSAEAETVMSLLRINTQLIERNKDYIEALRQLLLYQEKYPDDFDNSYRLVKKIMERRQKYYKKVEDIIKHIERNPDDSERIQREIDEFNQNLEKNPPEELAKMNTMLKEMYTFKQYAARFEKILQESSEKSLAGKYYEVRGRNRRETEKGAIEIVQDGLYGEQFPVYYSDFYTIWSDYPEISNTADELMAQVNQLISAYEAEELQRNYDDIVQEFVKAVTDRNFTRADELFALVTFAFKNYSDVRNQIFDCALKLESLYEKQHEINPEITDASYLPFMYRLILGSSTYEYSGLIGAMDHKWDKYITSLKKAVANTANSYANEYLAVMPSDIMGDNINYDGLSNRQAYISPIERYSQLAKKVNSLDSMLITGADTAKNPSQIYDTSMNFIASLSDQTLNIYKVAKELKTEEINKQNILVRFREGEGNPNFDSGAYVPSLFESVSKMSTITGFRKDMQLTAFDWAKTYLKMSVADGTEENQNYYSYDEFSELYTDYVNQIFDLSETSITSSWETITQSFMKDSDIFYNFLKDYDEYSIVYQNGFDTLLDTETILKIENNPEELLAYAKATQKQQDPQYYYSNYTVQMTQFIQDSADKYADSLDNKSETLTNTLNEHEDWLKISEITDIVAEAKIYLENRKNQIIGLKNKAIATTQQVRIQIAQALRAKEDADDLFADATAAYRHEQFDTAEELLERASEKYVESLAIVEDNQLRIESDNKKFDLSQKIVNAKNEIVIRKARDYYAQARDAMNYERYDDAETYITAAINTWSETHSEKDPEFEAFRVLVNTAVSMKTGSELLPSDPLYAEMSQLMNIAYQYYDEGAALMQKGQKEQAFEALDLADENVDKLKQVYPTNQEASLLKLKIERIRDSKKFNQEFAQKIQTAIAKCKNPSTQMDGYNQLLSYYNLDPNYKGLKQKVYDIEIELGMRQKPVDNSTAARAKRVTDEAESLFRNAGNNQTRLANALNKVNEALAINPNYSRAESLKISITSRMGASTVVTLSAEDENLYNKAQRAYSAGNYEDANMFMNQLLEKNAGYISVKKVADLKNKIEARL